MNLAQAEIILTKMHTDHPETKKLKPEEINDFIETLPEDEREQIKSAANCLRREALKAVVRLMAGSKL